MPSYCQALNVGGNILSKQQIAALFLQGWKGSPVSLEFLMTKQMALLGSTHSMLKTVTTFVCSLVPFIDREL